MDKITLIDNENKAFYEKEIKSFILSTDNTIIYKDKLYRLLGDSYNIETEQHEMVFKEVV